MVKNAKANMSFTGIASFAKLPIVERPEPGQADAVIVGVPYDAGIGFRPGARFGPRAIREMSTRYAFGQAASTEPGYFDIDCGSRFLEWPQIVDLGDVDVLYLDTDYTFNQITTTVAQIVRSGAIPVVLGGDHSITFPVVKGLEEVGEFCILHLDAHLDFKDSVLGVKLGNSSPIRRVAELPFVESIVTIGARGIRTSEVDLKAALSRGNIIIPASKILEHGVEYSLNRIPRCAKYYLTVDIDVLDPSIAPGTGSPEPDGLCYRHVKQIVKHVAECCELVGIDVVEVNPYLDPTQRTPLIASRLIIEALGLAFAGPTGRKRGGR
ncbi:MAG: agmatinase [Bacillota bacterium]